MFPHCSSHSEVFKSHNNANLKPTAFCTTIIISKHIITVFTLNYYYIIAKRKPCPKNQSVFATRINSSQLTEINQSVTYQISTDDDGDLSKRANSVCYVRHLHTAEYGAVRT